LYVNENTKEKTKKKMRNSHQINMSVCANINIKSKRSKKLVNTEKQDKYFLESEINLAAAWWSNMSIENFHYWI